jgi:hypothetical protein
MTLLRLQPEFSPQSYSELARSLRENGDEPGAIRVLIAWEDERYRQCGRTGAILGGFLKKTIGYTHRPIAYGALDARCGRDWMGDGRDRK